MKACANSPGVNPNLQQFTVAGTGLTAPAVVTPPFGFEASLSSTTGFGASVSLSPSGGSISSTTIFIRLIAFSTPGLRTGNIPITSAGAASQSVAVRGNVYALASMVAVSNKTFEHNELTTEIPFISTTGGSVFNWTNSNTTIGLSASGQGNIPAFTPVNTGLTPITATISVTPVSTSFAFIPAGDYVDVISTESREVIKTIPVGSTATGVAISPDGTKAFVSNRDSDNVSVININTLEVVATIAVGARPGDLVVSPNGTRVYVLNMNANTVSVINAASNAVIATIPVTASLPERLAIHPIISRLYVAGTSAISEINTSTNTQVNTYTIGNALTVITGIAIDPVLGYVYVSDGGFLQNKVFILQINGSATLQGTITTAAGPDGIVISPDGARAYIAISENDVVAIADLNTRTIINSVTTDTGPEWLAISPDGKYVYAQSNFFFGDISVINTVTQQPDGTLGLGVTGNGGYGNFISPGSGCSNTPVTFTLTVNPKLPEISVSKPLGTIVACEGEASDDPHLARVTVSGVNMKSAITVTAPATFEVSLSATTGFGGSVTLPAMGAVVSETIIYIRAKASAPTGEIQGIIGFTATDAVTKNVTIPAWINATPEVDPVSDQFFQSGTETQTINFTGNATEFNWTNSNPAIGLEASGSGPIFSFLATPGLETPIEATITVTPRSRSLAYIPFDDVNNLLSVMDLATQEIIWTYGMPWMSNNLAFSPDGKYVYTSSGLIINTQTRMNEPPIEINGVGGAIAISTDGSRLYIGTSNEKVVVINTVTRSVIATIQTYDIPIWLVLSRDGQKLFVSNQGSNTIEVINTSTNSISGSITLSGALSEIHFNPDKSILYAAHGSSISLINPATHSVIRTLTTSNASERFAVSPDDRYLLVVPAGMNGVEVIDVATNTIIKSIETGNDPAAVSIARDGQLAYVLNFNSSSMSVISMATLTLTQNIPLGKRPSYGIDFIVNGAGCSGPSKTFTITIGPPPPTILVTTATGAIETCEGVASVAPEVQNIFVSGLQLTGPVTATAPAGFEVSTSAASGYGASVSLTPVDEKLDSVAVYIRASVLAPAGTVKDNIELTSAGAELVLAEVRAFVHPKPAVNVPQNLSFVHGETTTPIRFTGIGGTLNFNWTGPTSIGMPGSGAGEITPFTATNTGSTPVIATVTVQANTAIYAYIPHNTSPGSIAVVNTETGVVEKIIPMNMESSTVAVSPDGRHVYVGSMDKNIYVISTASNSVVNTIYVGDYANRFVITADSKKIYANLYQQGTICIDSETNAIIKTHLGGGQDYVDMALDETNSLLYFVYNLPGSQVPGDPRYVMVNSVNVETGELNKFKSIVLESLVFPGIEVSPDGQRIYIMRGEKHIAALNTNLDVISEVNLGVTTNGQLELSRNGEYLFVADAGGFFHKINTATYKVEDIIDAPGDWSIDMFNVNRNFLYRLNATGLLSVINAQDGSVIQEAAVGEYPLAIGTFITRSSGCTSPEQTFTVTVYPEDYPLPTIGVTPISGIIQACVNQADEDDVKSFTISAGNLTNNVVITAPEGFEVALSVSGPFSNELTLVPAAGTINTTLYVQVTAAETIGQRSGDITLNSTGANQRTVTVAALILSLPSLAGGTLSNGTVGQTYMSILPGIQNGISYASADLPAGLTMSTGGIITGTPTTSATDYTFTVVGDNSYCTAGATYTITIEKQIAALTISGIIQDYDGTPKTVTVITDPVGLSTTVTYNGSGTEPTNAGVYTILATITSPNHQGSATTSMVIKKATATVMISGTAQNYSGLSRPVTVATTPAGLPVVVRYNGSTTVPINSGTYPVLVTVNSPNYEGTKSESLVVSPVQLDVTAQNATRAYGANNPTLTLSYSGFVNGETSAVLNQLPEASTTATATSNAGSYEITVAGGIDNNYTLARNTGTLTITKADQTITFQPIEDKVVDDAPFQLFASASSTLPITFTVVSGPATVNELIVTLTGEPGLVTIRVSQAGTINYNPVSQDRQFTVTLVTGEDPGYTGSIKIYPNPTSTKAVISVPASLIHAEIELVNVQGTIVHTQSFGGHETLELMLDSFARGVYLVRIKSGKVLLTRKLVVR
jgi:YVTN family beta-propeller protein